jgi:hypothetical protein
MLDNPNGLPIWSAVHGGGRNKTWKGEVGTLYWHTKHKIEGVGVKHNDDVTFMRACATCNKQTRNIKEEHCGACGGKKQIRQTCQMTDGLDGKKCTNDASYTEEGVHMCEKHYVAGDPLARACPQCRVKHFRKGREDKLCFGCVKKNNVELQRNAQRPLLQKLMEEEEGIEEWPGIEHAKQRTRYATLNRDDGYAPFVIVKLGNGTFRACASSNCCQAAKQNPDTEELKWCVQHGGGRRCRGADASGCPLGMSINREGSKNHIQYDGLCVRCFCKASPNDPRAVNAKRWFNAREQEVIKVLTEAFPDRHWVLDKGFARGVLERPDMRINGSRRRIILVEIDEDSHRSYECGKERAREGVFLTNAPIGATIVMLRFNPDSYTDYDGVKHQSCFKFNPTTGTTIVDPKQEKQWKHRCKTLIAAVANYLNPETEVPPPEEDRVIFSAELFYDNISGAPIGDAERAHAKKRSIGKLRKKQRLESSNNAEAGGSSSV